ncbi:OBAP family protein [Dyadobacter sp. CY261]|uniref:OBAP family protein n=1 Tax=Dyadobacter sp. CY261 TaxID=2907203 RepID=UPI001F33B204|nr:OBAP family protein [Dyadobacter sp. CY261]MCF0074199.1 OBAP family protein [Dyadobacter sp. CY261]
MKPQSLLHIYIVPVVLTACTLLACGGKNTESNVEAPGGQQPAKEKFLEKSADILQDKTPLNAFNMYLNGFHFYNGNMKAQMEAHHYVSQLNEDMYQAVIFDGNKTAAKLMGVEYIITDKLFKQLDEQEKLLWHSHRFEVKSGTLIAPGVPQVAEHELMKKLVSTYGKTIHTWHTDQQRTLPLGAPQIMMAFTKDGQLDKALLQDRDKRFGVSTPDIRERRADIALPTPDALADAWQKNKVRQLVISDRADSAMHAH